MHFALVLVGAHAGEGDKDTILQAASHGPVLLIEPVAQLYSRLRRTYGNLYNIVCLQACIAPQAGEVVFHAPPEALTNAGSPADRLGSLDPRHTALHDPGLARHFQPLRLPATTFADLIEAYRIESLDVLMTDASGTDAALLLSFPFQRLTPRQIVFPFRHADGPNRMGRTLGQLLIRLDEVGYDVQPIEADRWIAVRRLAG